LAIAGTSTRSAASNSTEVQRVRLDFVTPTGFTRHLLLGFTPDNAATDGVDYGYDGINVDNFANDLNWIIEDERYIIQGVGEFNELSRYPLGMFLANSGDVIIALTALENFDSPIDVFIYDAILDTYTQINEANYTSEMLSGDYLDRFYIAFSMEESKFLGTNEYELNDPTIKYFNSTQELYVNTLNKNNIKQLHVYNLLGQILSSTNHINATEISIPVNNISTNYVIVKIETDHGDFSKKILIY
jgi:hypothetical protein